MDMTKVFIEDLAVGGGILPVPVDIRSVLPGESRPVVVICPGFLGYKGWGFFPWLSERTAEAGFHVVTISFSHSGTDQATGMITRPDEFAAGTIGAELEDLDRVLDFVASEDFPLPVRGAPGLLGHSRGGSICIIAAGRRGAAGSLVTWAAASRLDRYTNRRRREWRRSGALEFLDARSAVPLRLDWSYYEDIDANRALYDVPARAAELTVPHLVVHGERDAAVSVSEARELAAADRRAEVRLEIIPHCGHSFGVNHPMRCPTPTLEHAARTSIEWLRRTLMEVKG
jgi:pimeloyl-ACP methyl ester carboxylesterase